MQNTRTRGTANARSRVCEASTHWLNVSTESGKQWGTPNVRWMIQLKATCVALLYNMIQPSWPFAIWCPACIFLWDWGQSKWQEQVVLSSKLCSQFTPLSRCWLNFASLWFVPFRLLSLSSTRNNQRLQFTRTFSPKAAAAKGGC